MPGGSETIEIRTNRFKQLLGQTEISASTNNAQLYAAPSNIRATITLLSICPTSGTPTYRLLHDDAGGNIAATPVPGDTAFALRYDKATTAGGADEIFGSAGDDGLIVQPSGELWVRIDSGACTFSLYGYEEEEER